MMRRNDNDNDNDASLFCVVICIFANQEEKIQSSGGCEMVINRAFELKYLIIYDRATTTDELFSF